MLADVQQHFIMHLAAIIGVAALALRDQLRLRSVLLVSIALNIVYYAGAKNGPSWDDVFWNAVTLLTNLWVLITLILDRTHVGLTNEEERLFQAFGSLSPGEFRKLVKLATWATAEEATVLTEEGLTPDHLFYVLDGVVTIAKAGRVSAILPPTFIGEVAFLKDRPASATVCVDAGTRYLAWSAAALKSHFTKKQSLRVAVMRLLSADLAIKVARA